MKERPLSRAAVVWLAAWSAAAGLAVSLVMTGCRRSGSSGGGKSESEANGALGERGSGGWEEIRIGTDAVFNGLHFVDSEVGWIVGGSPFVPGGIVGRTEDGGSTWRYRTGLAPGSSPATSLNAVHAFDRWRACIVGDGGVFLTFDGGEKWQSARINRGSARHLYGLHFIDDREGWAAGPAGILHTNDGGMTWAGLGKSPPGTVGRAIHFVDSRNGWLAGQFANLWRTRDGGETWARVPVPQPEKAAEHLPHLFGMTWQGASQGWVVGEFGTILSTRDGGDSWSLKDAGNREVYLTAVQFVDRAGWIVGFLPDKARSIVWHTADAGATWTVERRLEGEELRTLQMLDPETGWTVGDRVRTEPQRMLRRMRNPGR